MASGGVRAAGDVVLGAQLRHAARRSLDRIADQHAAISAGELRFPRDARHSKGRGTYATGEQVPAPGRADSGKRGLAAELPGASGRWTRRTTGPGWVRGVRLAGRG
jgi:hypothetical protein